MNMNVFLLEHLIYVSVFIYVRISVCECVCMHSTLSNCMYACVSIHVTYAIVVRVSFVCLYVLNLSGPRLPEAGFRPERSYGIPMSSVRLSRF